MKFIKTGLVRIMIAGLIVAGGFACQSRDRYVGTYESSDSGDGTQKKNIIELMENGEGLWRCCDDEVQFVWYVKEDELRINTKEGGIMVGNLRDGAFTITLPGNKRLRFTRIFP